MSGVDLLLAMVSGLLAGLGHIAFKQLVDASRETLEVFDLLELLVPLSVIMNHALHAVQTDPVNGAITVAYDIASYLFYVIMWALVVLVEAKAERVAYSAGYNLGSAF